MSEKLVPLTLAAAEMAAEAVQEAALETEWVMEIMLAI